MNNKHLYSLHDVIPAPKPAAAAESLDLSKVTHVSEIMKMPGVSVQAGLKTKTTAVFTLSKEAKQSFGIDGTALAPTRRVLLSGARFEQAYTAQLNSTLFNDQDSLEMGALMALISLSDVVEETKRPIRLMSQALRAKLPTICKALNTFYQDNHQVIRGISKQLSSQVTPPVSTPSA